MFTLTQDTYEMWYQLVEKAGRVQAVFTYNDGYKETRRLGISSRETIMVFGKGKRNLGCSLRGFMDRYNVASIQIKTAPDPEEVWKQSWTKALAMLDKSGLWPDMPADIRTGLEVGYTEIRKAYELYWQAEDRGASQIDPRLTRLANDGTPWVNTGIVWRMNQPARIKKMYFGKWKNQGCLEQIAQAFASHTPCTTYGRASYDVSFEYKPDKNTAWYSEEYKDCGNGHYYLALSDTHALFYEDD